MLSLFFFTRLPASSANRQAISGLFFNLEIPNVSVVSAVSGNSANGRCGFYTTKIVQLVLSDFANFRAVVWA